MKIFAADHDEKFLLKLEKQLLFSFDNISTVMCSDNRIFESELSDNSDADIFLVSESFFTDKIKEMTSESVFVLGNEESSSFECAPAMYVYKYDICSLLERILNDRTGDEKKNCLSVFCSPAGGTGTTTAAYLTAEALHRLGRNVLFVSLDPIQYFKIPSESDIVFSEDEAMAFGSEDEDFYDSLIEKIINNRWFCLPSFEKSYISFGTDTEKLCRFIKYAEESRRFEYIIADVSADISPDTLKLMSDAGKNVVCIRDDSTSRKKLKYFTDFVDCSNRKKFMFLCIGKMNTKFSAPVENVFDVPVLESEKMKTENPYRRLSLLI